VLEAALGAGYSASKRRKVKSKKGSESKNPTLLIAGGHDLVTEGRRIMAGQQAKRVSSQEGHCCLA